MSYRITIDTSLCSGFGSCVQEAPGVFRLDGGTATAVATTTDPRVLEAAASCPMGAISVEAVEAAA
jgi:ferredoxin